MTPTIAKILYVLMAVGWYVIRIPHERRARKTPVARSARGRREIVLLSISFSGLGLIPFIHVTTGVFKFANYPFQPALAWLGALVAVGSLLLFHRTHRALGRNWSVSLDLRDSHKLVTYGVYRYVRHPMYSAFWLWAIAQALLLPNFVAGFSGLVGFGTLYLLRVRHEERLMIEGFGSEYTEYMARTGRVIPWL